MSNIKNVLFIAIDDLRPELNCFGKKKLHTPNIDALAGEGCRFEHAYCQYPQCMPSRASLMSGIRPDERALGRADDVCANGEKTLPGHLKDQGYQTVSIGKIYHSNDDDADSWTKRYTDTFYEADYACDGYCSGYQLPENQRKIKNFGMQFGEEADDFELPDICEAAQAPDSDYPDGMVADRTVEVLNQLADSGDPFFLGVGFYRPHLPWAVPKRYWDLYDRSEVDLADNPFFPEDGIGKSALCDFLHYGDETISETYSDIGRYEGDDFPVLDEEKQRECVHGYWASVSFSDAQVGKVLDELETLGLKDETLIVLWGDNGWHLGEHKLWSKVTNFEESSRVPLVVSAPGQPGGVTTESLTELVDLYPTICSLLGEDCPDHVEGTSFAPLLENPDRPWKQGVFFRCRNSYTIRTEHYRFTEYFDNPPEGDATHLPNSGHYELFDLREDPQENVNVAKQPEYSDVVSKMKERLDAGWKDAQPDDV